MKKIILCFVIFTAILSPIIGQNEILEEVMVLLPEGEEIREWLQSEENQGLRLKKTLSRRMNIHLLGWEVRPNNPKQLLAKVRKSSGIVQAQFNHRVELRDQQATIPQDPFFNQQWGLDNTGQNGGLPDADIDAPEAWDLSQGGTSVLGDTLVVAVIDDGFFLGHQDILYWKNRAEIPNNGIDDDDNGYVDDFDGWNAYLENGNVTTAAHGTEVAGIIGGIADNNLGIAGVAWRTAVMPVMGLSGNEATVVEAYDYVLNQRLLYEESQGTKGAFVVATNASFGVNNGNPANFPIWCTIYDFLGDAGILNVAATANANVNVDAVGDIPTACTSDYLITVTSTDFLDQRNSSSAFGQVSIDLGAPGTGIYTTFSSNTYGPVTGTSFASPMVAGVIPLLFAAACPNLSAAYLNQPDSMALEIRNMLLNGTDFLSGLTNQVATDGRLNAFHALQILLDSCNAFPNDCVPPYRLSSQILSDTSLAFIWNQFEDSLDAKIRFRVQGSSQWQDSLVIQGSDTILIGFAACTIYEWQVATECQGGWSTYAPVKTVRTLGCCAAPAQLNLLERTDSTLQFSWTSAFGADQYRIEFRTLGSQNWEGFTLADTLITLDSLSLCTDYEIRLWSICPRVPLDTLGSLVRTAGCGGCTDFAYCDARGTDVSLEWIDSIGLGTIQNPSGPNGGYGDFTSQNFVLLFDSAYRVFLGPAYNGGTFTEKWRIWIDGNFDGQFDSTELVVDPEPKQGSILDTLQLPENFQEGTTRMRIAMRWAGFNRTTVPEACGVYANGEVEDYCVTLKRGDDIYCEASSEGLGTEWIEEVGIDTFTNSSGIEPNGYQLFSSPIQLKKATDINFQLIPKSILPQQGFWSIWADWNQNAVFEEGERWVDSFQNDLDTLNLTLRLPEGAFLGRTRLRIALRRDSVPQACGNFAFGEVEDYVIDIQDASNIETAFSDNINIHPNPTQNSWKIYSDNWIKEVWLYDLSGKLIIQKKVASQETTLDAYLLKKGIYLMKIEGRRGSIWKKVSKM